MLAARLNVKTLTLSMDDVPIPEPGPGQVRIKVHAAGVCLSDVHLIDGSVRPLHLRHHTVTLGHEIAGTVRHKEIFIRTDRGACHIERKENLSCSNH